MNKHKHRSKYIIKLSAHEKQQVEDITKKGVHQARVVRRARILCLITNGATNTGAAHRSGATIRTVERVLQRYRAGGLKRALYDAPRTGAPGKITPIVEARLIAIACCEPPEGHSHMTLELIKQDAIREGIVETLSTVAIWHCLNERGIKPWREKNVVHSEADG